MTRINFRYHWTAEKNDTEKNWNEYLFIFGTIFLLPQINVTGVLILSFSILGSSPELILPSSVAGGVAISKTFQILYRREEIDINDVILFKVHMLVDVNRVCTVTVPMYCI